ncbi:MAG: type II secretion system F family protein [Gammaproteobacteria bacterium]|nr:type II secretion system F family protein [Gammaproteobacteria bacterium]
MARYKYNSINEAGRRVKGVMVADNIEDVDLQLRNIKLELISAKRLKQSRFISSSGEKPLSRKERIIFTFQLGQLLSAGVPLLEGLADLRDSFSEAHIKALLSALLESIEGGESMSQAMSKHPRSFNNVYVNLIEVGEQSGELNKVLEELEDMLKWQEELRSQTKQIVMYPAIIGTIMLIAFIVLMIFVVPQMLSFMNQFDNELPLYTKALLVVSDLVENYWYMMIIVPLVSVVLIKLAAKRSYRFRYFLDKYKLKLWLIGPIMQKIKLARFSNNFALMYKAGITVLESMKVSKGLLGNCVLEQAIDEAYDMISEGETISIAIDNTRVFPPLVVRMFKIGESSGELDVSLKNVKYYFDREVKEALATIEPVLQPLLIFFLALILVWILASVFGPIYDSIGTLR